MVVNGGGSIAIPPERILRMSEMCLKDEELADYLEGRLSGRVLRRVEKHLSECDSCLKEIALSRGVVRGAKLDHLAPVPEEVTARTVKACRDLAWAAPPVREPGNRIERMRNCFQRVRDSFSLANLCPVPIRGTKKVVMDRYVVLKKDFSGLRMELEIEKAGKRKANLWVKILASRPGRKPSRASLFREGREISSFRFEDSGVLFEDVPFGHYTLVFLRGGAKIAEYPFEIKETTNG